MPLISIIVPVYKVKEEYLRQCLDSLVNQTFNNIEIILVDDGTPDNGGVICDEYAKKDKRVKVIHQKNQGVSAARNNGIKEATGEWITFVDADDWIELNTCEKLRDSILNEDDIDFVIFALKLNSGNKELKNPFWNKNYQLFNSKIMEELQIQILHPKASKYTPPHAMVGVSVCKLYKKSFLNEINLKFNENLSYAEDRVFAFWALENANKVLYINEYLYHYRTHSESVTHQFRKEAEHENSKGLKELENILIELRKGKKFYNAFYFRVILSISILCNQYYCHRNNNLSTIAKINEITNLCTSEPYCSAIKNVSIVGYFKNSSFFQAISFFLLKIRAYTLFYYLSVFKNNIKR